MRGLLRRVRRWYDRLGQDETWEVYVALGREERASYEEDRHFAEALAADPRREEPTIIAPQHRSDEEADHSEAPGRDYQRPDEHEGRHRARPWYDPEAHLAPWREEE